MACLAAAFKLAAAVPVPVRHAVAVAVAVGVGGANWPSRSMLTVAEAPVLEPSHTANTCRGAMNTKTRKRQRP